MKTLLQNTIWPLFFVSFLLIQCKKNPDTPVTPKSSAKSLTSPTIDGVTSVSSTFDASTSVYTVTVPFGTDITAIKLTFSLPTGAKANPASGSVQNFTQPVVYTITAEDGSTQTYTVRVTIPTPPKSVEKQITEFKFSTLSPVVSATIEQTTRKITATMPSSSNLAALSPTITLSPKATVSPTSGAVQNFTNPVNYTVTAENGTTQVYEVILNKTEALINLTNLNAVAEGLLLPQDAQKKSGALPAQSGSSQSPIIAAPSEPEIETYNGITRAIKIKYSNLNGKIGGVNMQVEGASVLTTIPFQSFYQSGSDEIQIPIGMNPQFDKGTFSIRFSVFDDAGRVSNSQKVRISVSLITVPTPGTGFYTRSDRPGQIFKGDVFKLGYADYYAENVVTLQVRNLANQSSIQEISIGPTSDQKSFWAYPRGSGYGGDVNYNLMRWLTPQDIYGWGSEGYVGASLLDCPDRNTCLLSNYTSYRALIASVAKDGKILSFWLTMIDDQKSRDYYTTGKTSDFIVVQGLMYSK